MLTSLGCNDDIICLVKVLCAAPNISPVTSSNQTDREEVDTEVK